MLKSNVSQDVAFDMEESVSFTGDSGPYLLYIMARIKSILRKSLPHRQAGKIPASSAGRQNSKSKIVVVQPEEKKLLLQITQFADVTKLAVEKLDPSQIAKYLFELAQKFNSFYENCSVLKAESEVIRDFRLQLINMTGQVMEKGLDLLGIKAVDEM